MAERRARGSMAATAAQKVNLEKVHLDFSNVPSAKNHRGEGRSKLNKTTAGASRSLRLIGKETKYHSAAMDSADRDRILCGILLAN